MLCEEHVFHSLHCAQKCVILHCSLVRWRSAFVLVVAQSPGKPMILTEGGMSSRLLRWELPFVGVFAWIAFISIPLFLGEIGISWDALNHHIYLGWTAGRPRFDLDFLAASYQSYQFPYLYWAGLR